jgi:predicted nucleotidyltransferase
MGKKKQFNPNQIFASERFVEICRMFDVSRLSLFGSYSRGEATSSSDLDLLVEFETPKSLIHLISLQNELSKELGNEVDLLTRDSISPYLREQILQESEPIYVKG